MSARIISPVIVESPYAGNVAMNLRYLRACLHDSAQRGESPYASHALLTQPGVLRDEVIEEREIGIRSGFIWRPLAKLTAIYEDLGWSSGMERAKRDCQERNLSYEIRQIGDEWLNEQLQREKNCDAYSQWKQSLAGNDARCWGCGKRYAEHADALPPGGARPRMPCLGLKSHYQPGMARK